MKRRASDVRYTILLDTWLGNKYKCRNMYTTRVVFRMRRDLRHRDNQSSVVTNPKAAGAARAAHHFYIWLNQHVKNCPVSKSTWAWHARLWFLFSFNKLLSEFKMRFKKIYFYLLLLFFPLSVVTYFRFYLFQIKFNPVYHRLILNIANVTMTLMFFS